MLKEVKIELTNKCSRNCKHCSSNATSSIGNLKVLDFEDVSRVIKEAKLMGAETIVFTGGEPLMYDRLSELVELTSKLGMKSTIYTFAYRTDETLNKYRKLIDLGLNKIVYSLADSLSDEEDISVYGKTEFFDKVFENNNARLGFHYTVSKDSFSRLEPVVTKTIETFKTRSYFDRVSLLRFVPHGKGTTDMDLSTEELLAIKNLYLNSNDKDPEYIKQKSLYVKMCEEFEKGGEKLITWDSEKKQYIYGDITQAYTPDQRSSIKEVSDMAYGYYDHESKSILNHTFFGLIFL